MFGMKGSYSDLWKAIIRPPRDNYTIEDLGPKQFRVQGIKVKRKDIDLKNERGLTIKCSHFEPVKRPCKQLPCVIYMHGNCSSRVESLNCLDVLIPQNITLFALDFSGCGQSEGEYISLGWYEREDIAVIVDYLRKSDRVSTIGLWGRSMGAVTALMHADRDPSIAGLVLDSPFSNLRTLAEDLCKKHSSIPKFVMSAAMMFIKSTIKDKAKFDLDKLNPLENHVKQAFINALFVYAKGDDFIEPKHTIALHDAYAGDKNIVGVDGDHNSHRPDFLLDSIGIFFYNTLQVEFLVPKDGNYVEEEEEEEDQQQQKQGKKVQGSSQNLNDFNRKQGRIGNEDLVQNALNNLDGKPNKNQQEKQNNNFNNQQIKEPKISNQEFYDEDYELEKAIQESLKIQSQSVGEKPVQKLQTTKNSQQPSGDNDEGMNHFEEIKNDDWENQNQNQQNNVQEENLNNYFIDDNGVSNNNYNQKPLSDEQQQQQQQNLQQFQNPYFESNQFNSNNQQQQPQNQAQQLQQLLDFDDEDDDHNKDQNKNNQQQQQSEISEDLI